MRTVFEEFRRLENELELFGAEKNEARIIICEACGFTYSDFLLERGRVLTQGEKRRAEDMLSQRKAGRPLQYIIGKWDFFGLTFSVGEGVLIPRPETEELCGFVIDKIKNKKSPIVFDLCSGSGCIGLSIKKCLPEARVYLIEKFPEAFSFLQKNRKVLGLSDGTYALSGDILDGYEAFSSLPRPDAIVSNPPYICKGELETLQPEVKKEPLTALDGGEDGLVFYRAIAEKWLGFLNEDGFAAVECGDGQAQDISKIFLAHCAETEIIYDFNGKDRIVAAFMNKTQKG